MPLIIPPGFVQAVYVFAWENDPEPMICTCGHDSGAWGGDFLAGAEFLAGVWGQTILTGQTTNVTLTEVAVYIGNDGTEPHQVEVFAAGFEGAAASTPLPQNCAYLMRKRTGSAGRRGRGRMYVPGVLKAQVNTLGVIDNTLVGDLQDVADLWVSYLAAGTSPGATFEASPAVILHRSEGQGTEPAPTPVTALSVDSTIATQRRRLRP